MDDISVLKVISMYKEEREEEIHLYIEKNIDSAPVAQRIPKCYSGKPVDDRPTNTKYYFYDDKGEKSNKVMLFFGYNIWILIMQIWSLNQVIL